MANYLALIVVKRSKSTTKQITAKRKVAKESPKETFVGQIARENREKCDSLSKDEMDENLDFALQLVYGSPVRRR